MSNPGAVGGRYHFIASGLCPIFTQLLRRIAIVITKGRIEAGVGAVSDHIGNLIQRQRSIVDCLVGNAHSLFENQFLQIRVGEGFDRPAGLSRTQVQQSGYVVNMILHM